MANRAMFYGPDSIMNAFEAMRGGTYCCWSMWSGNVKLAQYSGNDSQEAETMLNDTVSVGERTGNRELLQVRIHPKVEDIYTPKSPVVATLLCCCASSEPNAAIQGTQYDNALPAPIYHALKDMIAENRLLNETLIARIEKIESPQESIVEKHWIDRVGAIPGSMELLGQLLSALPSIISGMVKQPVAPNYAIGHVPDQHGRVDQAATVDNYLAGTSFNGGVSTVSGDSNTQPVVATTSDTVEPRYYTDAENEIIDNALVALADHMDVLTDLPLLAAYAAKNPEMFKMMLMQLKTQ